MFIENYDQSLRREGKQQLILIKENAAKESLDTKKILIKKGSCKAAMNRTE